jgi:hypothetical protein
MNAYNLVLVILYWCLFIALILWLVAIPIKLIEYLNTRIKLLNYLLKQLKLETNVTLPPGSEEAIDLAHKEILMRGGKYAKIKALQLFGGDETEMCNSIQRLSYSSLEEGGMITKKRYVSKTFDPK